MDNDMRTKAAAESDYHATRERKDQEIIWMIALWVLGIIGVAAFIGFAFYPDRTALLNPRSAIHYAIPPYVLARLDPSNRQLASRLVGEPCNRTLAVQLVQALLDGAEYGALIAFADQTTAKCGEREELLRPVLEAQMQSSDFATAEETANKLIAVDPANPRVYAWRSEARERRGDVNAAYSDMQRAFSLFVDPSNVALSVYYRIARLAGKTNHTCEAAAVLRDFIAYDPEKRRTQQLDTMIRGWQQQGSCPPMSGVGSALLRYDPNATSIIVPVAVNGVSARMLVDTGASRTAITLLLANKAGIEPSDLLGSTITTANGKTWVAGGRAQSISVAGASLRDAPVFIQTSAGGFGDGVDGLLGMSFLGNFQVRVSAGMFELRPLP
jgi:clan AA aspartic protease (TIGR02281 family)